MPKRGEVRWESFVSSDCGNASKCQRAGHTDWQRMVWDDFSKGWVNFNAVWTKIPDLLSDAIVREYKESNE